MRSKVSFDLTELTENALECYFHTCEPISYIQDTIHIGTKMRNRLLKPSIVLPMGNALVSVAHLKMLLTNVSKEVHGLVFSDICPDDRMNYASLEKTMSPRVLQALEKHIFGSNGTVKYLQICDQVTSSFLDNGLKLTERIYRIWNALYFLRAWRKWLIQSGLDTHVNFITTSAYICIEINAHGLLYIVHKLRNNNQSEFFLPELFSSQPCEHVFRQMRSMGTPQYTKITFTLFELFHLISRVDLMSEISISRLSKENVIFPRDKLSSLTSSPGIKFPSNQEILDVIKKAQLDALESAAAFGMQLTPNDIIKSESTRKHIDFKENEEVQNDILDDIDTDDNDLETIYSTKATTFSKSVEVADEDGSIKIMSKSELVWILLESNPKLSSDRLKRVQSTQRTDQIKRKRANPTLDPKNKDLFLFKSNEIEIGNTFYLAFYTSNINQFTYFNSIIRQLVFFQKKEFKSIV